MLATKYALGDLVHFKGDRKDKLFLILAVNKRTYASGPIGSGEQVSYLEYSMLSLDDNWIIYCDAEYTDQYTEVV